MEQPHWMRALAFYQILNVPFPIARLTMSPMAVYVGVHPSASGQALLSSAGFSSPQHMEVTG